MSPDQAKAVIAMLVLGLPSLRFSPDSSPIYERAVEDLDARETQTAVETLIKSWAHPRFPLPAEIRAEVARGRAERTRLADASLRGRAANAPAAMPLPSEWGALLPQMLEREARYRRMLAAHRARKGLPLEEPEPCPFLELARRGAEGADVRTEARKLLSGFGVPR